MGVAAKVKITR